MAGRRGRGEQSISPHWEDTLTEVACALRAMGTASSQQRSAGTRETPESMAAREFRRHDPPRFGGEPDPMAAEDWLNQIHRTLNMLNVREDHIKISLATYQFTVRCTSGGFSRNNKGTLLR